MPLFSIYGEGGLTSGAALRFGDAGGFAQVQAPRPLYIDYAIADRVTLGLAPMVEQAVNSVGTGSIHMAGAEIRAGYAFTLGPHVALCPHLGVSHLRGGGPGGWLTHRTMLVVDLKVVWTPNGRWALTLGPALRFPGDFGMPDFVNIPAGSSAATYPIVSRPQLSVSAGLQARAS